ncbi:Uncharacterized protein TCM_044620 [Theobroma cacao]|uniref:Uncharacterized protein n=1 Tax=Theobroma cacao TaxID=3641 RepID=A0A061FXF5_THECC|nr:Uncharacterized protein TCM_044620 [Theobroma cacao]
MAANPAVALAAQRATVVPVSMCQQLRRNVVTKTHETKIMAAKSNPVVQYEAGLLTSTPRQGLHRNRVSSKRDKTVMAAYPVTIQFATDIPECTECKLENLSGQVLRLDDKTFWEGSILDLPREIIDKAEFTHIADAKGSVIGSVGALVYVIGDGTSKWIIAGSNSKNDLNKVYTEMVSYDVVDWDRIKESTDKCGNTVHIENLGFSSDVEIDQTNAKPTMKEKFTIA